MPFPASGDIDFVLVALSTAPHPIGLIVAQEFFFLWVPLQSSSELHRDVGEVAIACAPMMAVDIGDGLGSFFDAVKEVLHVRGRLFVAV